MKKINLTILITTLISLSVGNHAFGSGFALYETSARGVAMGGAVIGHFNDSSVVFANPALITDAEKDGVLFGLSFINPGMRIEVETPNGKQSFSPKDQWFPPPFFFYNTKLNEKFFLGLGFYTPYGLGIHHSPDWFGRFSSVETLISAYNFNPNIAWKVSDRFSMAFGLDLVYFNILLTRNIRPIDKLLNVEGDALGLGGNISFSYKLSDNLGLGLVYRSEVREEIKGDYYVEGIPGEYGVWENLTLPQSLSFGANYTGIDKWDIGVIATWTGWSSYDNLTLHFDQPLLGAVKEAGSDKNWNNVWRFGVGAEYELSEYAHVAFGYVYDQDPINLDHADYLLPAGDRHVFSLGFNTKLTESWNLGITYARVILADEHLHARPQDQLTDTKFISGRSNVVSVDFSTTF